MHFSLDEDARWHREWSRRLIQLAIDDSPENAEVISNWIDAWRPLASEATAALAGVMSTASVPLDAELVCQRVEASVSEEIAALIDISV